MKLGSIRPENDAIGSYPLHRDRRVVEDLGDPALERIQEGIDGQIWRVREDLPIWSRRACSEPVFPPSAAN
jgi:hypothetical protein